jgi:hypothetical protein
MFSSIRFLLFIDFFCTASILVRYRLWVGWMLAFGQWYTGLSKVGDLVWGCLNTIDCLAQLYFHCHHRWKSFISTTLLSWDSPYLRISSSSLCPSLGSTPSSGCVVVPSRQETSQEVPSLTPSSFSFSCLLLLLSSLSSLPSFAPSLRVLASSYRRSSPTA